MGLSTKFRIPPPPSASDSGWISVTSATSYSASVSFTLSSAHGTKTVYVWFKDAAGNVSSSASDSIFLSRKAYVSDKSGKVSVIDLINETESASIDLTGQNPYWIASSANGDIVAVSLRNDSVALINSSTNTLLDPVISGLGSEMEAVAVNSTGTTVYAADESSSDLYVIDVGTMVPYGPIDLSDYCDEPENMVISPDDVYLYITCASGGGAVIRVATSDFAISTIDDLDLSDPHGIALNSTGTRLYYTDGTDTYEYDTDTSALTGTVFTGCDMYNGAVSPDGSRLYCVEEDSTLSIYNTSNGILLDTVALGGCCARGVAVSLDGTRVYVPLDDTDSVKVINADTMTLSGDIPVT